MKFDREIIIGIIICAVILFGWGPFARSMGWMPSENAQTEKVEKPADASEKKPEAGTSTGEKNETPKGDASEKKPEAKNVAPGSGKTPDAKTGKDKVAEKKNVPALENDKPKTMEKEVGTPKLADLFLENSDVRVTIDPNLGAVTEIQLKKYKASIPLKEQSNWNVQQTMSVATASASLATMVASIANILKK